MGTTNQPDNLAPDAKPQGAEFEIILPDGTCQVKYIDLTGHEIRSLVEVVDDEIDMLIQDGVDLEGARLHFPRFFMSQVWFGQLYWHRYTNTQQDDKWVVTLTRDYYRGLLVTAGDPSRLKVNHNGT